MLAAAAAYLLSIVLVWRTAQTAAKPHAALLCWTAALILHAAALYRDAFHAGDINLALGLLISLAGWMTAFLLLIASLVRPTVTLALIVAPLSLGALLLGGFAPGESLMLGEVPPHLRWHLAIALPTYAFLSIAVAQALIILLQERQLRRARNHGFYAALPALQTMDANLFWLTAIGFVLMTLNIFFGVVANYAETGRPLALNHHILLASLAWCGFAALLWARKFRGRRGKPAARATLGAFFLLALAYYGTRFVSEVVLG